jgi:hypothetical protein
MTYKIDLGGNKSWYLNGELHRDGDLPAVVRANGYKEWWINGMLHRDNDLPALIKANGDKEYWINRELHRSNDLPAIELANGDKRWYVNGKKHRDNYLPAIEYTYEQVCNYYQILKGFGRYCLRKIRINRLRKLRRIHGELLCMPPKGSYAGGQDYHQMVSYFMNM